MLLAQAEADKQKWKEAIETAIARFGSGLYNYLNDYKSLQTSLFIIIAIIAGVYFSREGAKLSMEEIKLWLKKKPSLVRETNSTTSLGHMMNYLWSQLVTQRPMMEGIIFDEGLDFRLRSLATSLRNTRKHGAPLRHILFHGPPGTGKTMVARRIAQNSGLDYAIMSGGDVAPLKAEAVTEIHNLIKWAKRSSRGLMLFIDAAEASVGTRARANQSEHLRNALNAILFHTGVQSQKFMMVLATNRPQDIDAAIIDRIDDAMAFTLPTLRERQLLCRLYYKKYITTDLVSSVVAQVDANALSIDTSVPTNPGNNESSGTANKTRNTKGRRGRQKKATRAKSKRSRAKSRSTSRSRRARARNRKQEAEEEEEGDKEEQTQETVNKNSPSSPKGLTSTLAWAQVAAKSNMADTSEKDRSAFDQLLTFLRTLVGGKTNIKAKGITKKILTPLHGSLKGFPVGDCEVHDQSTSTCLCATRCSD